MKNYDYWKKFINTGKIDDYLHYIACTREDNFDDFLQETSMRSSDYAMKRMDNDKEGGLVAGIKYRNRDGSIGHAGW